MISSSVRSQEPVESMKREKLEEPEEEIRSVETPVQRHRRIKKENKSALQVEDLCLDVELAEKKKKMTEFSAEIRILSRLTMAGTDITQKVEGWINKVADAER